MLHHYCLPCDREFVSSQALDQHRQNATVHRNTWQVRVSRSDESSDNSDPDVGVHYIGHPDEFDGEWESAADTASVASGDNVGDADLSSYIFLPLYGL